MAVSALAAAAGGAASYSASQKQQQAQDNAQLSETKRQGDVMRSNMQMQDRQRQDAEQARGRFEENTLPAFTRKGLDADTATEQTRLQTALQSAGQRAFTPSTGASGKSSAVTTSSNPSAPVSGSGFEAAFADQLGGVQARGNQQASAQAAMAALVRARQLGGERLQNAGQAITLSNARNAALNRAISANGLYSGASSALYQNEAEKAANKGAGLALLGSSLSTMGNAGYSYGSGKQ